MLAGLLLLQKARVEFSNIGASTGFVPRRSLLVLVKDFLARLLPVPNWWSPTSLVATAQLAHGA